MNCRSLACRVGIACVGVACTGCWSGNTTPPEQTPFYAPTYEPPAHGRGKAKSGGDDVTTDSDATEPARPTTLTLRGEVTSIHVKHTRLYDEVKSTLTFRADVTATPALADGNGNGNGNGDADGAAAALDFYAADIETTLAAPDAAACEPELVFELDSDSGTLTGTFTGTDTLGTLDCSTWLDAVATDGFDIELTNVPWLDARDDDPRATVKLSVTRTEN